MQENAVTRAFATPWVASRTHRMGRAHHEAERAARPSREAGAGDADSHWLEPATGPAVPRARGIGSRAGTRARYAR